MYQNIFVKSRTREAWVWDDQKGLLHFKYSPYAYKRDSKGKYTSMYGEKLSKVTDFERYDPNLLESDVSDTTRILIDMYGDSDIPSTGHRVMTFDIEVEMVTGTPDPQTGNNEITSIAYHDSVTDVYTVLVLDKKGRVKSRTQGNQVIVSCPNERTLLLKFLSGMDEIRPTIITGWNINAFDIPYIYNRISNVLGKRKAACLSPIEEVYYSSHRDTYTIGGVSVLDYMIMYKKFSYKELPSYSLNYVSTNELERGKLEYEGNLDDLMESDIDTFIQYNITDCELVKALDEKLQFIDLVRGICHVGHVPYEDFIYSSKYLEGALLTYLRKIEVVAPNKPIDWKERMQELGEEAEEDKFEFEGAFVKDPIPGRYEWIYDLDLTSLYPSIIMTLNISPETKVGKIKDWDSDAYTRGTRDSYIIEGHEDIVLTHAEIKQFIESNKYTVGANGAFYTTDSIGLLPAVLNDWFDKRVEYKNEMKKWGTAGDVDKYEFYKKRQLVQKILLNSLYGVLGLPVFRWFDIDNAEAVTLTGRTVIQKTQDVINLKYNSELQSSDDHVIYIDTDSVFVSCLPLVKHRYPSIDVRDDTLMAERIYEIANEVQAYVNKMYDVLAKKVFNASTHRFEIKQEMIAKTGFWTKKKRYALKVISDNGLPVDELKIVGLDVVRSSYPISFKKFMKEILSDILLFKDKAELDEKIIYFKKNVAKEAYSEVSKTSSVKNIAKYEILNDDTLGKFKTRTPSHVKAAINYNRLLKLFKVPPKYPPVKNGDKIKIAYLKQNPYEIRELAFRGESDPSVILDFIKDNFDAEALYNSEIKKKLDVFYDAMGWSYPSEYTKLAAEFFSF